MTANLSKSQDYSVKNLPLGSNNITKLVFYLLFENDRKEIETSNIKNERNSIKCPRLHQ